MRVNILGTDYEIVKQTREENPKLKEASGLCEIYAQKIVLTDYDHSDLSLFDNLEVYDKQTLRHEIIHAFFAESGLHSDSDYASNEELVDWIAIQFPKMLKVFQEVDAL